MLAKEVMLIKTRLLNVKQDIHHIYVQFALNSIRQNMSEVEKKDAQSVFQKGLICSEHLDSLL